MTGSPRPELRARRPGRALTCAARGLALASACALVAAPGIAAAATPTAPTDVRISEVDVHSIELRWHDGTANERRFEVSWGPAGGPTVTDRVPADRERFRATGLAAGTVHRFAVSACNHSGCSNRSPSRRQATLLAPYDAAAGHADPGCQVLPPGDAMNTPVTSLPVDSRSDDYIDQINSDGGELLHPDFGSNPDYGIPYVVVPAAQPLVPIELRPYPGEADPDPYPIPPRAPVEGDDSGNGDRHVLVVRRDDADPDPDCELFELYRAFYRGGVHNSWTGYGARFDLGEELPQRPEGWTSADAAGLPIFPGLVRYEEAEAGAIEHAIRITFDQTQAGYMHPATHRASDSTNCDRPPMGLRLRLRAGWYASNSAAFGGHSAVILAALRNYGAIVADNGSNWFITGATDPR